MPRFDTALAIQVLILSTGIYLVLGLLRTARGSSLARGLGIATLVGGVGLWGVANFLELEELKQVLDSILGVAFIVLAILFQPELRRGILSLGDHKMLRRLLGQDSRELVSEVAAAVVSMAKKRQGALIAFERKTPLDAIISEKQAAKIDAPISRDLLENLFYPGAPLHDGGVVLRGDRVSMAAAVFPLSENADLSKSTGTRHRAALGLCEQTDAITVVVSEETGNISIGKAGELERRVARERVEEVLREHLGEDAQLTETNGVISSILIGIFTRHLGQKAAALGLGVAVYLMAHQQVTDEALVEVQVAQLAVGSRPTNPVPDQLIVLPPEDPVDDYVLRVQQPRPNEVIRLLVKGPGDRIAQIKNGMGGHLLLTARTAVDRPLDPDEFRWGAGSEIEGLDVRWADSQGNRGQAPQLVISRFVERSVTARDDFITVELPPDHPDGGYFLAEHWISPTDLRLLVPADQAQEQIQLRFRKVIVDNGDAEIWSSPIELADDPEFKDFELLEPALVHVRIGPVEYRFDNLQKDVELVNLEPNQSGEDPYSLFQAPRQKATLRARLRDVRFDPSEPVDPAFLKVTVDRMVEELVRVYVDVDGIPASEGGTARVQLSLPTAAEWRKELVDLLTVQPMFGDQAEFEIELVDEDRVLDLEPVERGESEDDDSGDEQT